VPTIDLVDAHRVPGPSLHGDQPCAVVVAALDGIDAATFADVWRAAAAQALKAVGWQRESLSVRAFAGGVRLAISAPIDALYAAADVNLWAFGAARAWIRDGVAEDIGRVVDRLRAAIAAERAPCVLALRAAAVARGVTLLADPDAVSIGTGIGSRTYPTTDLPDVDAVPWNEIRDVPIALVTGSRGAAAVARLLAGVGAQSGFVVGAATVDGVRVDHRCIDRGDGASSIGARLVLRDRSVELAVLQTGREHLLRRGLVVPRATTAAVTDVDEDEVGFGLAGLDDLVALHGLVARAVTPPGRVVVSADDAELLRRKDQIPGTVVWCSRQPSPAVGAHLRRGGCAVFVDRDAIVSATGSRRDAIVELDAVPAVLGGAARFALANCLAAAALALELRLPSAAIRAAFQEMHGLVAEPCGGLRLRHFAEVAVGLQFASDPQAMARLHDAALRYPAERRTLFVPVAAASDGARTNALAVAAASMQVDRVHVIGTPTARAAGSPLAAALTDRGVHATLHDDVDEASVLLEELTTARAGDLLLVLCHSGREAVSVLLDELRQHGFGGGSG
jgi:cyanophycin synthetase